MFPDPLVRIYRGAKDMLYHRKIMGLMGVGDCNWGIIRKCVKAWFYSLGI
jgi:hypothetical protein